jgi:hypothetical protein
MPVLMSTAVLYEMEAMWPEAFGATRRNRLRASEELEMNFLYHHYVRLQRYPTTAMPNKRVGFGWMHECGEAGGAARCSRKLSPAVHDWICFNDKELNGEVGHSCVPARACLSLPRARRPQPRSIGQTYRGPEPPASCFPPVLDHRPALQVVYDGANALRRLLHRRFGSFSGGAWRPSVEAGVAAEPLNFSGAFPGYCSWTIGQGRRTNECPRT